MRFSLAAFAQQPLDPETSMIHSSGQSPVLRIFSPVLAPVEPRFHRRQKLVELIQVGVGEDR